MPASSRAHLLLPSPQGLLHYDILEETAFVGPTPRGGLQASPTPFPAARIVLADDGHGYVVRALPGEAAPDVNGAPGEGTVLTDGARIRLGEQVVLFRTGAAAGVAAPPAAAPPAPTGAPPAAPARPRRAPARTVVPPAARRGAGVLALAGALVLLLAAYQAVHYLQTPLAPPTSIVTERMTRPTEVVPSRAEESAATAFAGAEAYEAEHLTDLEGTVSRYQAIVRDAPSTSSAERAAARVAELWPRLAAATWKATSADVDAAVNGGKYRRAIAALEQVEARFGGTEAAAEATARLEAVRTAARAALDALRQRAAPLMATDPTRAYRVLTTSGLEFPPDLEAELAAMMGRVRETWGAAAQGPGPEPGASTGAPGRPGEPAGRPPGGGLRPLPTPPDEGPTPSSPAADREAQARSVWLQAHADLAARKWLEARKGYASLSKDFKDTALVSSKTDRVRAGRQAADFGLRGPAALLTEEATYKDGRLEVEYQFEEPRSFTSDFAVEQPFPGEDVAQAEIREGMAILAGSTAMLLKVVFDPSDVTWEADCMSDEPRDFGLLGFQEGHEYRVCAMHVGNTQLRLKKGPAAQVLAGHVLWLFGDGVWKDADPGERGFVRLAVKNGNQLRGGERIRVRCEVRAGQIEGEIHAKSDTVDLKGALKGDDGRGMGPMRVGAFAYKGRVGVQRLWVSGKVDAAWAARQLESLLAAETGPD